MRKILSKYPAQKSIPWNGRYHSAKQAYFVINSMNGNPKFAQFDQPYQRTGSQGKAWKLESPDSKFTGKGFFRPLSGSISWQTTLDESVVPRGRYVQGSRKQGYKGQHWRMQEIGWMTPERLIKEGHWSREEAQLIARLNKYKP
ncbi:MAG: hypothetical protein GF347_00585 [Candidatus Moranbacteria bacterium]|nr:hypothetical protein [Candidatus Moranbacteria bacterium]